jgi:hypothetical protein
MSLTLARFISKYIYNIDRIWRWLPIKLLLDVKKGLARLILNNFLPAELVDAASCPETGALQLASGPTKVFGEIRSLMTWIEDRRLEAHLEFEVQAPSRTHACEGPATFAKMCPVIN